MRHDDAVIVVVLHPVEEVLPVGKVFLRGIEDAVGGIGRLIGGGNLRDVGLHADDDGLVGQAESFHLVGGDAHRHRLAGADLMVADAAAVLQQHPHAVLLGLVDVANLVLADSQPLQVKAGECLMTAVIAGTDKTVVLPVVHIGQVLLPLVRMTVNPLGEAVANLVNLAGRQLYLLMVRPHDGVAVGLVADALVDDWNSVIQGMAQQVLAVVGLRLARHGKLLCELGTLVRYVHHELVKLWGIAYLDVGFEELGGELGEIALGHPALAEVEVQLIVCNRTWAHGQQGMIRAGQLIIITVKMLFAIVPLKKLNLFNDIAGKELVGDFILSVHRIVIYALLQLVAQLVPGKVADGGHVFQVNAACTVQRGGERINSRLHMSVLVDIERDGTEEDVSLHEVAVLAVLQCERITALNIHQEKPGILSLIQVAVLADEAVIVGVQVLAKVGLFLPLFCLLLVQLLVGIPYLHVELHAPGLVF